MRKSSSIKLKLIQFLINVWTVPLNTQRFPSLLMRVRHFFLLFLFILLHFLWLWTFAWLVLLLLVSGCCLLTESFFFLLGKWAAGGIRFSKRSFYHWVHWPYYIARQGNWWLVMYCWGFLTGSEFLAGHPCYLLHVTRRAAGLLRSHSLSQLFCLLRFWCGFIFVYVCCGVRILLASGLDRGGHVF